MKHTMKSVMEAVEAARTEGNQRLPILTSNQCHALAEKLNVGHQGERGSLGESDVLAYLNKSTGRIVSRNSSVRAEGFNTALVDRAHVERLESLLRASRTSLDNCALQTGNLQAQLDEWKKRASRLNDEAERHAQALGKTYALLREIGDWLVCESIAAPEDMAQSFTPFREAIEKVLAVSAEPSAPVEKGFSEIRQQHYDDFMQRREARAELGSRRK